jgi:hypothetical protein
MTADSRLMAEAPTAVSTIFGFSDFQGTGTVKLQKCGSAFLAVTRDHEHA